MAAGLDAASHRYEFLELLGQGSMGRVHRVVDRETGQVLALKALLSLGPDDLLQLKREFRVLAGISHPNLVQLYDLVVADAASYLTMELVEGRDFVDHVQRDEARARESLAGVAAGLGALHEAGIVHRDVKPSNVLVARDGRVVLVDFGLASPASALARASRTGGIAGTLAYMAPELLRGAPATPASDWYSVGVMLFEALTGELPFSAADLEALVRRRTSQAPAPRDVGSAVSEDLDALTRALLLPEPGQRAGRTAVLATVATAEAETAAGIPPAARGDLIGRSHELEALREGLASSRAGSARLLVVRGPSGMGKTTLIERFADETAESRDAVVLRSRCHPYESVPYKAVDGLIDELSRKLLRFESDELEAVAPRGVAALCRLFPVLERVPFRRPPTEGTILSAEPHEVRRRGVAALRELLARIADRRPVLLCIDDAQWGDGDSMSLLEELLRPPDPPSVLWLVCHRSDDGANGVFARKLARLAAGMGADSAAILDLAPLGADEIRELLAQLRGGGELDEARVREVVRESQGLPLFASELARASRDADRGRVQLEDVIAARIERLGPKERSLVTTLAVLGGAAALGLLGEISGLGAATRYVGTPLENARLLRARSLESGVGFELYHDRIREAVLSRMDEELLRARHLEVARVLSRSGDLDPQALYAHYLAGGDLGSATRNCLAAADAAARQLAFDRAAELYRKSLEIGSGFAEPADVLPRLADALAHAGRGREAAEAYQEAARGMPPGSSARRRAQRLAAEQYLMSGYVDEGKAVLRPLARELGLPYPQSPVAALARTGSQLARLALGRARFRAREEADVDRRELDQVDLCYSAAKGLLAVDSIRGGYFNLLGAVRALRCGEPSRVGRCLALVGGGALGPAGGRLARLGVRMMDAAETIAEERAEPRLRGALLVARGQTHLFAGRWRKALEESDRGVALLTEQCRGVAWECDIGRMAALRALEELGDLRSLRERSADWKREAGVRGDLYGEVTARLNLGLAHLADAATQTAREEARRVFELWSHEGFHVQHLYALRLELYADLYEGSPAAAWRRFQASWPGIRRSLLLRFPLGRLDVHGVVGRVALRLAEGDRSDAMLSRAERHARALERERRAEFLAHAAALRAGVARLRGEEEASRRLLAEATRGFDDCEMGLYAACARVAFARAGWSDAEEDARAVVGATVADADAWVDLFVPGFARS